MRIHFKSDIFTAMIVVDAKLIPMKNYRGVKDKKGGPTHIKIKDTKKIEKQCITVINIPCSCFMEISEK